MELTLEPKVVEVINNYMVRKEPIPPKGLERICIHELRNIAENVIMRNSLQSMIRLKGQPQIKDIYNKKHETYFHNSSWYQYSWWNGRQKWGLIYFIHGKCERYFESNSKRFILNFLSETYGNIETAVSKTDSFIELSNDFIKWFDERRNKFMEQTDTDIQKWKEMCVSSKPQSHGGVANLLKVLTKTMEKQGADIANIAKVQYAVCLQAGIYIPDEFVRDVAVTLDMKELNR